MVLKLKLFFILLISSTAFVCGQGRVEEFALTKGDLIEDLIFDYYDNKGFNGSILVVEDDQIVYENTFGFADFENEEPLDRDLPFYLASLAKQFTAASILRLSEQNKLSLEDPVTKFLPLMPGTFDVVKIRHLLSHTSGVPDYFTMGIAENGTTNMDVYEALVKRKYLDFKPGYKFQYSNSGYVLLAMVIQVATGQTIDRYFHEEIFDRFNMQNAFVFTTTSSLNPRVKGYTSRFRSNDYNLLTVGDGGIYATAYDLYKWEQALNSGEFIKKETLNELYKPLVLENGRVRNYAYGWETGNNLQGKLVYHTGGLAGFRTYLERQLGTRNSIIILTNNSFSQILELRNTLVKILDGRIDNLEEDSKK
ncbi:MAG: serine hydrolase domain-containing protein [Bacteroidota bacterium]